MSVLTPYLCVPDSRAALEWYAAAFDAEPSSEPIVMDDGRVGHCEFTLDGARVMMSDAFDSAGVAAPDPARGTAVTLHLGVATAEEVDRLAERAAGLGATLDRPPEDTGHGRGAVLHDPFGHRWFLMNEG